MKEKSGGLDINKLFTHIFCSFHLILILLRVFLSGRTQCIQCFVWVFLFHCILRTVCRSGARCTRSIDNCCCTQRVIYYLLFGVDVLACATMFGRFIDVQTRRRNFAYRMHNTVLFVNRIYEYILWLWYMRQWKRFVQWVAYTVSCRQSIIKISHFAINIYLVCAMCICQCLRTHKIKRRPHTEWESERERA